jgi:hypothetical protein
MAFIEIAAADALKLFRGQNVTVQEARPVKVRGDDGKERDAFETKIERLAESHILSAIHHENGRVSIVTMDGKHYDTTAPFKAPEPEKNKA